MHCTNLGRVSSGWEEGGRWEAELRKIPSTMCTEHSQSQPGVPEFRNSSCRRWMEKCMRGYGRNLLHHAFVPLTLACILLLLEETACDAGNLLKNGDFLEEPFTFGPYPTLDVIATGIRSLLPYWMCVHGGVQLLDSRMYTPPANYDTTFVVHMNYRNGPGHLVSMPMYTPRRGAVYSISMSIGDNPDGGPSSKSLMLQLYDSAGAKVAPTLDPFIVSNSNISSSRQNISWRTISFQMLGTGEPTLLYVASLVSGAYGLLVADIRVNLHSLIDNGSFEDIDSSVHFANNSAILQAPSSVITNWNLESGMMTLCKSSAEMFQASTDSSGTFIDLNANETAGTISKKFKVNAKGSKYALLFDTAANPTPMVAIAGQLMVQLQGGPSGKAIDTQYFEVNGTGYTPDSVGWETKNVTFRSQKDDTEVKITFTSKLLGSFGPFLDNVQIYEIFDNINEASLETNGTTSVACAPHPPIVTTSLLLGAVTTLLMFPITSLASVGN